MLPVLGLVHILLLVGWCSVPTVLRLEDRVRKIPKHCVVLTFDGVGEDGQDPLNLVATSAEDADLRCVEVG